MISAFQLREFGFGFKVTPEQLNKLNDKRKGQKYTDCKAAIKAGEHKDGLKPPLPCSLFIKSFEYGADHEGYWNYQHMLLHLEDCVNVLKEVYPQYDYLFFFDHYSGHDCQKEDGLNVEKTRKQWGGMQAALHDTTTKKKWVTLAHLQEN